MTIINFIVIVIIAIERVSIDYRHYRAIFRNLWQIFITFSNINNNNNNDDNNDNHNTNNNNNNNSNNNNKNNNNIQDYNK